MVVIGYFFKINESPVELLIHVLIYCFRWNYLFLLLSVLYVVCVYFPLHFCFAVPIVDCGFEHVLLIVFTPQQTHISSDIRNIFRIFDFNINGLQFKNIETIFEVQMPNRMVIFFPSKFYLISIALNVFAHPPNVNTNDKTKENVKKSRQRLRKQGTAIIY